jgi:hypothetical protein
MALCTAFGENNAQPATQTDANSGSIKLPFPPGRQIRILTRKPDYANEPSIAVNPVQPEQIVAAFQIHVTAAYSHDAGHNWAVTTSTAPDGYRVGADVSVTYDNQGHAFLAHLAFDKLGTENYWVHGASRHGIFVRRSFDGGETWDKRTSSVIVQPTKPGIPFEDKPYIVADATNSRYNKKLNKDFPIFFYVLSTDLSVKTA